MTDMTDWKGHFINGHWVTTNEGSPFVAVSPVDGKVYWRGYAANQAGIEAAVGAADTAFAPWASLTMRDRQRFLEAFCEQVRQHEAELAQAISLSTGKPLWESRTEVASVIGKLAPTVDAYETRAKALVRQTPTATSVTRFLPHGVVAVISPFNFPAHMANGHIMPALLAGNTVILKQSERVPAVAEILIALWHQAGLPPGVLNLLQGDASTVLSLARHPGVKAIFFTGSRRAGLSISEAAGPLGKLLALEMGGNSPIVAWDCSSDDVDAATLIIVQSAFSTAGQRCSNGRRLIVGKDSETFLRRLTDAVQSIVVGPPNSTPEPYMGPLIDRQHADSILQTQEALEQRGGRVLVRAKSLDWGMNYISPGLIDVTEIRDRPDEEVFGPLLQIIRVKSYDEALAEANRTSFGLAAGLVTSRPELYDQFLHTVRAGIINLNQPLTGASSFAPFGGIKASGNGRPSGYLAVDYCTYATGSLEAERLSVPASLPPGLQGHSL